MRDAFAKSLRELAPKYKSILVTGDLGYGVFDEFREEFGPRFLNAGITEQSLTSMAAGLSDVGWIPIIYSIANFPTLRNFEQIRNDISYPNRHVIVCSVGAGLAYGALGTSHFAIEDIGALRTLPNMRILSPSGPTATRLALEDALANPCPTYLRLGKNGEVDLVTEKPSKHARFHLVSEGSKVGAVMSTGSIGIRVVEAMENMASSASFYSIEEPWPVSDELTELVLSQKRILVVEEHVKQSGLFSILSELIQSFNGTTQLRSIAIDPLRLIVAGSQDYLRDISGLSIDAICDGLSWLEEAD
ncbi:hypothetical protein OAM63_00140 [bacterium]|nr:hypothetical protein [bacterium]MDC0387160.1 hypothetical protein [bacterium]